MAGLRPSGAGGAGTAALSFKENVANTPRPMEKAGQGAAPTTTTRRVLGDLTNVTAGNRMDAPTTTKKALVTLPAPHAGERSVSKPKPVALFAPTRDLDVEYMPPPLPPAKFDPHYELMPELLSVPPFPAMPSGLPRLRYPLDQPLPDPGFALEENEDPADPDDRPL